MKARSLLGSAAAASIATRSNSSMLRVECCAGREGAARRSVPPLPRGSVPPASLPAALEARIGETPPEGEAGGNAADSPEGMSRSRHALSEWMSDRVETCPSHLAANAPASCPCIVPTRQLSDSTVRRHSSACGTSTCASQRPSRASPSTATTTSPSRNCFSRAACVPGISLTITFRSLMSIPSREPVRRTSTSLRTTVTRDPPCTSAGENWLPGCAAGARGACALLTVKRWRGCCASMTARIELPARGTPSTAKISSPMPSRPAAAEPEATFLTRLSSSRSTPRRPPAPRAMAMSSVPARTRGESTLAGLAPLAAAASLACAAETRCDHGTRPERGAASPARSTDTAHHPSRVGPALIVTSSPRRTASSSAASAAKSDTTHAISPTQPEEGRRPEAGPLRGVCGCCRSLTGVGGAPADSVLEQTPILLKKSRSRRPPGSFPQLLV
mmetsp:Transcript_22042/g.70364  ORF Transcript_22042/g.70364 Transcript_22042/m.70364 type:complete len:446 (-) Transcript_22042:36-1373(-)